MGGMQERVQRELLRKGALYRIIYKRLPSSLEHDGTFLSGGSPEAEL